MHYVCEIARATRDSNIPELPCTAGLTNRERGLITKLVKHQILVYMASITCLLLLRQIRRHHPKDGFKNK